MTTFINLLKTVLPNHAYIYIRGAYQKLKIQLSEERYYALCDPSLYFKTGVELMPGARRKRIVYASYPSIWEQHNIEKTLRKYYGYSFFYVPKEIHGDTCATKAYIDGQFYDWLAEEHRRDQIDLIITYFSGAEVSASTLKKCRELCIPMVSFHYDDRLHFRGKKINGQYSGPISVCRQYDRNYTNAPQSLSKYRAMGACASFLPEAANPDHFKPTKSLKIYDVSFIGARYGYRESFISQLAGKGINVECFGPGWPNGVISEDQMVEVYNASWINLGFGYIGDTTLTCLKGRDFEVPSCGAVYMTTNSKELDLVYDVGNEILSYASVDDCAAKITNLLKDKIRLKTIACNARKAVLERHTWQHRFEKMINDVGYDD